MMTQIATLREWAPEVQCDRVFLPFSAGHFFVVPPGAALQVCVEDQQLLHPHRGLEHVFDRCLLSEKTVCEQQALVVVLLPL